ncbi:hypothetical protein COHCIP112018_04493 [Cohnella sp. JJ-181]|nr:hypothetical protein COHCIP112018_04493 [Cohnella sp. JJ-181]
MEKITITGMETKQHIQEALTSIFPTVKFSLISSKDSVLVSWTDGPLTSIVEKMLIRFAPFTSNLDNEEHCEATGYEWKGKHYIGARYLNTHRKLSDARLSAIKVYMEKNGWTKYCNAHIPYRIEIEKEMIATGLLLGIEPVDLPDRMHDECHDENKRKNEESATSVPDALKKSIESPSRSEPSNVVPLIQKEIELPFQLTEQLSEVAEILWNIIELGDILEKPIALKELEKATEEMVKIWTGLKRINKSFPILHTYLQQLSEQMDKLTRLHRVGPETQDFK